MDIQLPVLDGYEATRRIRTYAELKTTPIIAVTSYALSGDEAKTRAAGCDGYVAKPFSPRELLAKIREYLLPRLAHEATGIHCLAQWRRSFFKFFACTRAADSRVPDRSPCPCGSNRYASAAAGQLECICPGAARGRLH